jgi:hypothetical protein
MDADGDMFLMINLVSWGLLVLGLGGIGAIAVAVEKARMARAVRPSRAQGRNQASPPQTTKRREAREARAIKVGTLSFWRWPTALAYLFGLWVAYRALADSAADPYRHPGTFVFFGLGLGLALTLAEWQWYTLRQRDT